MHEPHSAIRLPQRRLGTRRAAVRSSGGGVRRLRGNAAPWPTPTDVEPLAQGRRGLHAD